VRVRTVRHAIPLLGAVGACGLALLGLAAVSAPPARLALPPPVVGWLSLAALSGSQFVFMTLVADRCLSRASRRLVDLCEALVFVVFVAGCLGFLAVFLAFRFG